MILQLDPPIPVITPLGPARAVGWIDRGEDYDLEWICLIKESRIVVTFRQPYIRMIDNLTDGREVMSEEKLFASQSKAGKLRGFMRLMGWIDGTEDKV